MARWKHIRRKLRRPFETGGFLLIKSLIPLLPRGAVVGLARFAGRIALFFPLREKRIGLKNLDAVFGATKTDAEKRRILASSLATFAQTMLDVFWFSGNPEARIKKYVEFEASPLKDSFFEDKAVICITAHMGSWEIMGQAAALLGADMASIAATVKNQVVDRILIEQRERTGQTIIPQKGALKTLIARFRKKGKAAFVLDQNTEVEDGGIVVDFLGLPMPVSPAPAALAYRTGTEIMLGFCLPEQGGRYRIRVTQSIVPPPFDKERGMDEIVHGLTQQIQDGISAEIRAHPEYWLWSYKHWRRSEGQTYPANYPVY
ncbi:lysophospholipid acyltransferase family protein [Pontiella sp.]|uniref:lysophospholipid acyltransferase family protein n=1 Tax=Pontiella sp. TaxID=2837462 RepID=UPI003564B10D